MQYTFTSLYRFYARSLLCTALVITLCMPVSSFADDLYPRKKITLATDQWQPFYGPELEHGGFMIAVCKAAFKAMGYNLEVKFMPWKRAVKGASRGLYDGLLGAYHTETRAQFYYYSNVLGKEDTVLVALAENELSYNSLADLAPYKIGVMRGAVNSTELDHATGLNFSYSNSGAQNLRKLLSGRIDFMVTGKEHLNFLVEKHAPKTAALTVYNPSLKTNNVYITLSKKLRDSKSIMQDFNKGLAMIQKDGTFLRIKSAHLKTISDN